MSDIYERISRTGLHDLELVSITADNRSAEAVIMLNDLDRKPVKLKVSGFISLSFPHEEPWGKGTYIAAAGVFHFHDEDLLTVQLNSGDEINIRYTGGITEECTDA